MTLSQPLSKISFLFNDSNLIKIANFWKVAFHHDNIGKKYDTIGIMIDSVKYPSLWGSLDNIGPLLRHDFRFATNRINQATINHTTFIIFQEHPMG